MAASGVYTPPSTKTHESPMRFHVSEKHNNSYKYGADRSTRNATSSRKIHGPKMNIGMSSTKTTKYDSTPKPVYNSSNFPTLSTSEKNSSHKVNSGTGWSTIASKAVDVKPKQTTSELADDSILHNKATKRYHVDGKLFMNKQRYVSSYAEERFEEMREREFEEEMNQITGYDECDNWTNDDDYYSSRYQDDGFEESYY